MAQEPQIRIKRGETLLLECTVRDADGSWMDLTGWTIASQVRDGRDALIASLVVNIHTPATGQYRLSATSAATATWPPGLVHMDIAYTDAGGRALSTETLTVNVEREVTQR